PGICAAVRILPTRSTTTIVAGLRRALASLIACSTILLASAAVRLGVVPVLVGEAGSVAAAAGGPVPPPLPPQPEGAAQHSESSAIAARNAGWANNRAVTA